MRTHPTDRPAPWSLQRRTHQSALSGGGDRNLSTSGNPDLLLDLAHHRAESNEVIGGRRRVASSDLRLFQSFGENPLQIRSSDGFREMIKCSKFNGLNGIGTIGKSRKDNDRSSGFVSRRKSIPDTPGIFRSRNVASAWLTNSNACRAPFARMTS